MKEAVGVGWGGGGQKTKQWPVNRVDPGYKKSELATIQVKNVSFLFNFQLYEQVKWIRNHSRHIEK